MIYIYMVGTKELVSTICYYAQEQPGCVVANDEKSLKKVLTFVFSCGNICKHLRER